jgi:hypothetical protein
MREFEFAMAVGAAMLDHQGHLIDPLTISHRLEFQVQQTTNAAHRKAEGRKQKAERRRQKAE